MAEPWTPASTTQERRDPFLRGFPFPRGPRPEWHSTTHRGAGRGFLPSPWAPASTNPFLRGFPFPRGPELDIGGVPPAATRLRGGVWAAPFPTLSGPAPMLKGVAWGCHDPTSAIALRRPSIAYVSATSVQALTSAWSCDGRRGDREIEVGAVIILWGAVSFQVFL